MSFLPSFLKRKSIDLITVHEEGRRLVPDTELATSDRIWDWCNRWHWDLHLNRGRGRKTGPAVLLSFVIAGVICACAALAYAEMATMMPVAGSTYTYSYVALGEGIAWIVGWSLILEYSLVVSALLRWDGPGT